MIKTDPISRALISVSDKTGIVEFASALAKMDVEILSTGGTAKRLRDGGVTVIDVANYTGSPEILGGRVKTLHPKVHGGLLYIRDDATHEAERKANNIGPIDLVVVNLYPFEQTVAKPEVTPAEAIEQIDIGGPSMIRSAAKNHTAVTVVTDPTQYEAVAAEMEKNNGATTLETRRRLAVEAFALTAAYDSAIHRYLHQQIAPGEFPARLTVPMQRLQTLRYGENPHQKAAFYRRMDLSDGSLSGAKQLNGLELSYINVMDMDTAFQMSLAFDPPFACVIKHATPCGAATGADLHDAYERAYAGDPVSAFGCILGLNRPVDAKTATALTEPGRYMHVIVAPKFEPDALEILTTRPKWRKSVRLIEAPQSIAPDEWEIRHVSGGALLQTRDAFVQPRETWKVMTEAQPDEATLRELEFAWRIGRFVKSNAIVLTRDGALVGDGAGQTSRVGAAEIALAKAGDRAKGACVASDAYIPFPDLVELMAPAGVKAIVEPGGSKGDDGVVAAAEKLGITLVFTGERHFRH